MAQPMGSKLTTDHDVIKGWVEERGGKPAVKKIYTEKPEEKLEVDFVEENKRPKNIVDVSWDKFFKEFDTDELAFMYQDETADGEKSWFYRFTCR